MSASKCSSSQPPSTSHQQSWHEHVDGLQGEQNAAVSAGVSTTAAVQHGTRMEGTLQLRLLRAQKLRVGSRPLVGDVVAQVTCDSLLPQGPEGRLAPLSLVHTSEGGCGAFTVSASTPACPPSLRDGAAALTVSQVPFMGTIEVLLFPARRNRARPVARATMHLHHVKHQHAGGDDIEHCMALRPLARGPEVSGQLWLKAFWISTDAECREMQLLVAQVCQTSTVQCQRSLWPVQIVAVLMAALPRVATPQPRVKPRTSCKRYSTLVAPCYRYNTGECNAGGAAA